MVSSAVVDPIASILRTTRSTRSGKPVNGGFASLAPTAPLRSRLRRRAGSRGCGARHGRDRRSRGSDEAAGQIGRAHVCTPVTNAHLVCLLLLEKKKRKSTL